MSAIDPVGVPDFDSSADLACDDLGNCFLAFLDSSDPFSPRLQLALSTNGGQSFSPVAVPETPATDTSVAAGAGSVWLASGSTILAAPVLGLGAVGAFSQQRVPFTGTAHKPDIAVGPGGKALVVAQNLASPSFVEASVDPDGLGPAGFRTAVRFETLGAFPFQPLPQAAWDRARDRVYLVYRGPQVSNGHEARDILLRSSSDSGLSWSSPVRVNADVSSEDRLVPNVAVDPATGTRGRRLVRLPRRPRPGPALRASAGAGRAAPAGLPGRPHEPASHRRVPLADRPRLGGSERQRDRL